MIPMLRHLSKRASKRDLDRCLWLHDYHSLTELRPLGFRTSLVTLASGDISAGCLILFNGGLSYWVAWTIFIVDVHREIQVLFKL